MALVNYSDSEDEELPTPPPVKKRKVSSELPPLPASFLDQYSSTVRTSTQDDPLLHGGRKRVTPHVEGNWPTHVYLEWHPQPTESELLSRLVSSAQGRGTDTKDIQHSKSTKAHSLLENELGVSRPLHISLSRPLVLRTDQREKFPNNLKQAVSDSNIAVFDVEPKDLAWHPNESNTRWFLVLRLQSTPEQELNSLLGICNNVAKDFGQPTLYAESEAPNDESFHISVAWSLQPPNGDNVNKTGQQAVSYESGVDLDLLGKLKTLSINFSSVKVRIGQDVHSIPLRAKRRVGSFATSITDSA